MMQNNNQTISLCSLLPAEITSLLENEPAYRGLQIFQWVAKNITDFDAMNNIPLAIRHKLAEKAVLRSSSLQQVLKDPDGTIKLQISLYDGYCIETVLLQDEEGRNTACVSCQAGCAMGCAFCQTGTLGLSRNLSAGEIVEQFLFLEAICGKLDNIVFMGMGEPLMNLTAIRKSIEILSHEKGRNLSRRRITLSTSGIIDGIYDLTDNGPAIRLAVSLTSANTEIRTSLMPITTANPLDKLKKAIHYYNEKTGNRCTLEVALLSGLNSSRAAAEELIDFTSGLQVHINVIPWNPVENLPFTEPSATEQRNFIRFLEAGGLNVTLRTKRGRTIGGACGQLGGKRDIAKKP